MGGTTGEAGYEVKVVSAIPGRVRFKVPAEHRTEEAMRRLSNALAGLDGAETATNPQTGSLLLRFDPQRVDVGEIERALADVDVTPVFDAGGGRVGTPAGRVKGLADRLNSEVAQRTKGVDLRLLVPLGLGALSLRQAVRDSPGLKHAPWYVLAWYAFDSFVKLNGEPRGGVSVGIPERLAVRSETQAEARGPAEEIQEVNR